MKINCEGMTYSRTNVLCQEIASLAAGATEVLTAPELEALFGTWTGRARLTIDAEVPTLEAYCLIRAANGTLTNLSPVAP